MSTAPTIARPSWLTVDLPGAPTPGGLVDDRRARRLFATISDTIADAVYPYQPPLSGRAGPWVELEGRRVLMLSAYDYLGLLGHPALARAAKAAIERFGTGAGGVRLLTGTLTAHTALEAQLADFLGVRAATVYGSGYLANLAAIGSLMGPRDRVIIDERAHRSLHDACRLARVPTYSVHHNDIAHFDETLRDVPAARRTLIVVDGVYSMDGDLCPLPALVRLKTQHNAALLVDIAHALGVVGDTGRGPAEHFGVSAEAVDVWTGSLSKAIPAMGGFVAGAAEIAIWMQHASAPYIFSSALSPADAASARAALSVLAAEPDRLRRLRAITDALVGGLRDQGWTVGETDSAILPLMVGSDAAAYRLARDLIAQQVLTSPCVFPAVPRGQARLRLCATAGMSDADVDFALAAFAAAR